MPKKPCTQCLFRAALPVGTARRRLSQDSANQARWLRLAHLDDVPGHLHRVEALLKAMPITDGTHRQKNTASEPSEAGKLYINQTERFV